MDIASLKVRAQLLASTAADISARVCDEHEADRANAWPMLRSSRAGSRDSRVYQLGAAIEVLDGLDIDPIRFLGFLAAGARSLEPMVDAAAAEPLGSVVDYMRAAIDSDALAQYFRELGEYYYFNWSASIAQLETAEFNQLPLANDPTAHWRSKPPTPRQLYIVDRICNVRTAKDPAYLRPKLKTRGDCYDFIARNNGNPRFWPTPDRPAYPNDIL